MNAQTANIDPAIIRQATAVMKRQGMSMDDTLKVFYSQICLQNKLPISNFVPNEKTVQAMHDLETNRNCETFNDLDDLFNYLNN